MQTKLRDVFNRADILSSISCLAVAKYRRRKGKKRGAYIEKTAFIFDQFKRPEEIRTLRQVYGRLFVAISIYSEKDNRAKNLSDRIALERNVARASDEHEAEAKRLIARDEDEEGIPNGQRLRDAFPLADVFVNIDQLGEAEGVLVFRLQRLVPAFDGAEL